MGQGAELAGVHLETLPGLLRSVQAEDIAEQECEGAAHVALEARGRHLGVERVPCRQRGAGLAAQQAVPRARLRLAGGTPLRQTTLRRALIFEYGAEVLLRRGRGAAGGEREERRGVVLLRVQPQHIMGGRGSARRCGVDAIETPYRGQRLPGLKARRGRPAGPRPGRPGGEEAATACARGL